MIKKQFQGGDPNYTTTSGQHLLAAAEASAITAMAINPVWVVKTRVFGTTRQDTTYRGLTPALRDIYRQEGIRGLYKGSLLALVGVSNGSIQFATYEEIKRRRADIKRKLYESNGKPWRQEDEKLVSRYSCTVYFSNTPTHANPRQTPSTFSPLARPNSWPSPSLTPTKSSVPAFKTSQPPFPPPLFPPSSPRSTETKACLDTTKVLAQTPCAFFPEPARRLSCTKTSCGFSAPWQSNATRFYSVRFLCNNGRHAKHHLILSLMRDLLHKRGM